MREKEAPQPYREILELLLDSLKQRFGNDLVSVVVYGSVARGEARADSDVDLLIVAKNLPRSRLKRQSLFMEVEKSVEPLVEELWEKGVYVDFSPILKTPEEASRLSPLYLDMVDDAVILYDKDGFFSKVLSRLRKCLRQLGARRVRAGKLWYWVLKEPYSIGESIVIE